MSTNEQRLIGSTGPLIMKKPTHNFYLIVLSGHSKNRKRSDGADGPISSHQANPPLSLSRGSSIKKSLRGFFILIFQKFETLAFIFFVEEDKTERYLSLRERDGVELHLHPLEADADSVQFSILVGVSRKKIF